MRLAALLILSAAAPGLISGSVPRQTFGYSAEQISWEKVALILDDVCPGGSRFGTVRYVDALGCGVILPSNAKTAGKKVRWRAEKVTFGHFLSPTSDDAAISGWNPSDNPDDLEGGTLLITREAGKWRTVWYKNGVLTSHCKRVTLEDQRQILFCEETRNLMTHRYHFLYSVDFLKPQGAWHSAFFVADSFHNQYAGVQVQRIERIAVQQFAPGNCRVQVYAAHGGQDVQYKLQAGERRWDPSYPEASPVDVTFYLLGTQFKPAPDSHRKAKLFGRK